MTPRPAKPITIKHPATAACEGCRWTNEGLHAGLAATQHFKRCGSRIRVEQVHIRIWEPAVQGRAAETACKCSHDLCLYDAACPVHTGALAPAGALKDEEKS
jgi:hypothetical protein